MHAAKYRRSFSVALFSIRQSYRRMTVEQRQPISWLVIERHQRIIIMTTQTVSGKNFVQRFATFASTGRTMHTSLAQLWQPIRCHNNSISFDQKCLNGRRTVANGNWALTATPAGKCFFLTASLDCERASIDLWFLCAGQRSGWPLSTVLTALQC